jgi:hypothetical protein
MVPRPSFSTTPATKQFDVKILHQQCYKCKQFGKPSIETREFIKRVAQRLKVWNGFAEDTQDYQPLRASKANHKSSLCEGCHQGTCHFGRQAKVEGDHDENYTFRG